MRSLRGTLDGFGFRGKRRLFRFRRGRSKRRGFTLVETIGAVAIMGLLIIVLSRVMMAELGTQRSVDQQYTMLSADAFLADIYKDFHNSVSMKIEETPAGRNMLTFKLQDGNINIYAFDTNTQKCLKNGVEQFDATSMSLEGAGNNLVIYLKVSNERILEMNVFK